MFPIFILSFSLIPASNVTQETFPLPPYFSKDWGVQTAGSTGSSHLSPHVHVFHCASLFQLKVCFALFFLPFFPSCEQVHVTMLYFEICFHVFTNMHMCFWIFFSMHQDFSNLIHELKWKNVMPDNQMNSFLSVGSSQGFTITSSGGQTL